MSQPLIITKDLQEVARNAQGVWLECVDLMEQSNANHFWGRLTFTRTDVEHYAESGLRHESRSTSIVEVAAEVVAYTEDFDRQEVTRLSGSIGDTRSFCSLLRVLPVGTEVRVRLTLGELQNSRLNKLARRDELQFIALTPGKHGVSLHLTADVRETMRDELWSGWVWDTAAEQTPEEANAEAAETA